MPHPCTVSYIHGRNALQGPAEWISGKQERHCTMGWIWDVSMAGRNCIAPWDRSVASWDASMVGRNYIAPWDAFMSDITLINSQIEIFRWVQVNVFTLVQKLFLLIQESPGRQWTPREMSIQCDLCDLCHYLAVIWQWIPCSLIRAYKAFWKILWQLEPEPFLRIKCH